eukprot:753644-Hanusia_phi.AAC.3
MDNVFALQILCQVQGVNVIMDGIRRPTAQLLSYAGRPKVQGTAIVRDRAIISLANVTVIRGGQELRAQARRPLTDIRVWIAAFSRVRANVQVMEIVTFNRRDASVLHALCPFDCWGHGACLDGKCVCDQSWTGFDCSIPNCPNACSGRGICQGNGVCHCQLGFSGSACEQRACLEQDCSGHGSCANGTCVCDRDWTGIGCESIVIGNWSCPADCSGHGVCEQGLCFCDVGWSGTDCFTPAVCPQNCMNHGACLNGSCAYYPGTIPSVIAQLPMLQHPTRLFHHSVVYPTVAVMEVVIKGNVFVMQGMGRAHRSVVFVITHGLLKIAHCKACQMFFVNSIALDVANASMESANVAELAPTVRALAMKVGVVTIAPPQPVSKDAPVMESVPTAPVFVIMVGQELIAASCNA